MFVSYFYLLLFSFLYHAVALLLRIKMYIKSGGQILINFRVIECLTGNSHFDFGAHHYPDAGIFLLSNITFYVLLSPYLMILLRRYVSAFSVCLMSTNFDEFFRGSKCVTSDC